MHVLLKVHTHTGYMFSPCESHEGSCCQGQMGYRSTYRHRKKATMVNKALLVYSFLYNLLFTVVCFFCKHSFISTPHSSAFPMVIKIWKRSKWRGDCGYGNKRNPKRREKKPSCWQIVIYFLTDLFYLPEDWLLMTLTSTDNDKYKKMAEEAIWSLIKSHITHHAGHFI